MDTNEHNFAEGGVSHAATAAALASPAMSASNPAPLALVENVRALVEKSVSDTRVRYARTVSAAQEATAAVEASYGAARGGAIALQVKAIEALRAGADANFAYLRSLAGAQSPSDLVALQTEFARKSFADVAAQAQGLAELARATAGQAAAPFQAQAEKLWRVAV